MMEMNDKSQEPVAKEVEVKAVAPRLTLRKDEKLRHKSLVGHLFDHGKNIYDYPVRLVWCAISEEELAANFRAGEPDNMGPLQMLITIPKKKRRRAVDRVLLRRRIREAYRLNRLHLADVIKRKGDIRMIAMAFIFLGDENTPYATLEKKVVNLLTRLERKIEKEEKEEKENKEEKE